MGLFFARSRTREGTEAEFAKLRKGCMEGSERARRAFIRVYEPLVWRTVMSRFGTMSREDQEEVVADTFIALLSDNARLLARYNSTLGLSPQGYIRRQAVLQGLNRHRRLAAGKRKQEVGSLSDIDEDRSAAHRDRSPGPEEQAAGKQMVEQMVNRLREELSPALALTFELLYVRDLEPAEAARVLGCSMDVVYQRKRRLLKAARSVLRTHASWAEGGE